MRVDLSNLVVNQTGQVEINIDNLEDFWTLANVIRVGDRLRSQIRRKVTKLTSTGNADKTQKLAIATIEVTEVDYQPGVDEMNIRGRLVHDLFDAKEGSFQRVLLDASRPFTLIKDCWDQFTLDELKEASDPTLTASIAAVIMKSGVASICVVGRSTSVVFSTVTKAIPKIRTHGASDKHSTAKQTFFGLTADALVKVPNIYDMPSIIVASPGFLQHEFVTYLRNNQVNYKFQNIFATNRIIEATISNGDAGELDEVLLKPEVQSRVSVLKAVTAAKAYDEFMSTMGNNQNMVCLGDADVIRLAKEGAVKTFLVTDIYIRTLDLAPRLEFLNLKTDLENSGTEVVVFSSKHSSGLQLQELGGIAAILKYAVEKQEEEFDDDSDVG
ncbi:eRF1 domain 3 family protein [Trichomonas vaginalis G3]|uniref:ERF1 domain 3 family protein n=1 Tax=Trichomonas vaginalis (strain ATCC PRA-98 / G3) TaxID=412133 RepID=A2DEQ3_TRIV3|nr:nuclear-transcribed mRNA catabolic process, no-go decay [Trichomonas vaginalis G3]EAY21180.1 eRF1 domain 3 family protein [Trichomonas vaginalis G3]KAI5522289.1 nuclear-transcribed mRNA catabolic process, no-go decay [Trichomonas vaginalis G3]|eukprot:XP_001582166.1 eRF1 domain 3 family protein [Trichomonas vaginalis G3]